MKKRLEKRESIDTLKSYAVVFLVLIVIIFIASQVRENVSISGRVYDFLGSNNIGINPQTQSVSVGNSFNVEVVVKQVTNVYGVQFDLSYDSAILEFSSIQRGSFLGSTLDTFWVAPNTATPGKIDNAALTRVGKVSGVSGDGVIATITFRAKSAGTSAISLSDIMVLNPDGNKISINNADGSVTVSVSYTCTDSDGGKNYGQKGTTTLGSQSETDRCQSSRKLLSEFYCENNQLKSESYTCSGLCEDGACIGGTCTDSDSDTYYKEGGICGAVDCNDNDVSIYPSATEVCNNKDDDCDNSIDEGVSRSCYTGPSGTKGIGICIAGTETCNAGTWSACVGQVIPTTETCNNQDDDCDNSKDESLTRQCGTTDTGPCTYGTETCQTGNWVGCNAVTPTNEICGNGADEDCTGSDLSCEGDLNGDKKVDIVDFALVGVYFGQTSGFDQRADVNKDGVVNLLDLYAVAKNFGVQY